MHYTYGNYNTIGHTIWSLPLSLVGTSILWKFDTTLAIHLEKSFCFSGQWGEKKLAPTGYNDLSAIIYRKMLTRHGCLYRYTKFY